MDGQTDAGHINLIGGLVTYNPPKNVGEGLKILGDDFMMKFKLITRGECP